MQTVSLLFAVMKIFFEPIRNWFGFSRRERRASSVLLIIIVLVISIRYTFPESNVVIKDVSDSISQYDGETPVKANTEDFQLFYFDPNSASYDTLLKLGLGSKEANTLIKYRTKGGKFRYASDLGKVYGIDSIHVAKLIPFVRLEYGTKPVAAPQSDQKKRPLTEINSCDSAALAALPGIGPVLSLRIIKYRNLLGGFVSVDQIKEVYGLPPETFDLIKSRIIVDTLLIRRVNINTADYKELIRIPYIEKYEVTAILKYKELEGEIRVIGDLIENKLLTEEKALKIRPYLKFE